MSATDVVFLQEVPRGKEGWSTDRVEDRLVLHHRCKAQWRGTGIAIHDSHWSVRQKIAARAGAWFHLKGLTNGLEVWCGTFHFPPGIPLDEFESSLANFLAKKPRTTLPVMVQGDVNAHFRWEQLPEGDSAVSTDGRSLLFRDRLLASGLHLAAPIRSHQGLPTSRPRQEGRTGHHIDIVALQRVLRAKTEILVDSHMLLGTDHECIYSLVKLRAGTGTTTLYRTTGLDRRG